MAGTRARVLKLYVWEGAFSDWWSGIAFALAYDIREARRLVADKYAGPKGGSMRESALRELAGQPAVIRLDSAKPQAWQLSGGG